MGACTSKLKEHASFIDPKAIQAAVMANKVRVARNTRTLADSYLSQMSASAPNPVTVSQGDVLPLTDYEKVQLRLTQGVTGEKEVLTTALYVSTNTIYRNQLKKEIWADEERALKQKFKDAGTLSKVSSIGQPATNAVIDKALDQLVVQMKEKIMNGEPLYTATEEKQLQEYEANRAKQHESELAGAGKGELQKDERQALQQNVNTATTAPSTPQRANQQHAVGQMPAAIVV